MDKYDIIIQAGQSNAEGCGRGDVSQEYIPSDDILYLDAHKTVTHTPQKVMVEYEDKPFFITTAEERDINGKVGDFALTFSKAYKEKGFLKDGRKLLIIRAAIGGTSFARKQWGVGSELYPKMLEMTDYALSLHPENKVVAFLWHQGEGDSYEGSDCEKYYTKLIEQIQDARRRYGNMPFITADFVNEWKSKNIQYCEPIITTIKKVAKDCGNGAFIETSDLLSNNQKTQNGDDIHFCRDALHILGERYFAAFERLKNEKN